MGISGVVLCRLTPKAIYLSEVLIFQEFVIGLTDAIGQLAGLACKHHTNSRLFRIFILKIIVKKTALW